MTNTNKIIGVIVAVVIIGAVGYAVKSQQETKKLQQQLESLQQTQQQAKPEEVKKLVEEISKLIVLPEGEDPTVATITDKEKLKDVPFFTKAENGDKVLIYVAARKAFLYREKDKKIIEVATLNLNTANQAFTAKVALRNGTEVAGLTKRLEDALKQGLPKVEVTGRDNAAKTTYTDTLVIDLTGSKKDDAQKLANALGGKVSDLPSDEPKPTNADFLVIIGAKAGASASPVASTPIPSPKQ